jgi:hypothetical protein
VSDERRRRAHSIRTQLDRLARSRGDDMQLVLTRYANERALARLATSEHADRFVLKGAALFTVWTGEPHRATRDLDLLGHGVSDLATIASTFAAVLGAELDDGVEFDVDSMTVGPIREDQRYGGVRVVVLARISSARIRVQIDIGFGDAVRPRAERLEFPSLLERPGPLLWTYTRATVVAEKLEAAVQLGLMNSRMKDFFDLAVLAERFEFEGGELVEALQATFERRGTRLSGDLPVALTAEFANDPTKQVQWAAFARKSSVARAPKQLEEVLARVRAFALAPLAAAATRAQWTKRWPAGGPWTDRA